MQLIYIWVRFTKNLLWLIYMLFMSVWVLHSWGSTVPSSQKEKNLIFLLSMKDDAFTLFSVFGF